MPRGRPGRCPARPAARRGPGRCAGGVVVGELAEVVGGDVRGARGSRGRRAGPWPRVTTELAASRPGSAPTGEAWGEGGPSAVAEDLVGRRVDDDRADHARSGRRRAARASVDRPSSAPVGESSAARRRRPRARQRCAAAVGRGQPGGRGADQRGRPVAGSSASDGAAGPRAARRRPRRPAAAARARRPARRGAGAAAREHVPSVAESTCTSSPTTTVDQRVGAGQPRRCRRRR